MKLFDQIFLKKQKQTPPPLPSWKEVVDTLYDQDLDSFPHEVVEVLYSHDRSKRYVILKSNSGFYTFRFEKIGIWDKEEWDNLPSHENIIPGWWDEPLEGNNEKSFYGTFEELMAALYTDVYYQQYFTVPCMDEQHYCPYLQKAIDEGLCYDMQMIANGYISGDALPNTNINKNSLLSYCSLCDHSF